MLQASSTLSIVTNPNHLPGINNLSYPAWNTQPRRLKTSHSIIPARSPRYLSDPQKYVVHHSCSRHIAASKPVPSKWSAHSQPDVDVNQLSLQFWDKRGFTLTENECAEAIHNMSGFIMLLDYWERQKKN